MAVQALTSLNAGRRMPQCADCVLVFSSSNLTRAIHENTRNWLEHKPIQRCVCVVSWIASFWATCVNLFFDPTLLIIAAPGQFYGLVEIAPVCGGRTLKAKAKLTSR